MPEQLLNQKVFCPYCGEQLDMVLDASAGEQRYVEDCAVCCRPIECRLLAAGDGWQLELRRDDE
jgi:hypothetical protein